MKRYSSFLGPFSQRTEQLIQAQPILFTLIILYQGLFSGNAIQIPQNLKVMFDNKSFRFFSIMAIAFSATQDIEYALIATVIFIGVMYVIKTPEEREKTGLI
jgi:hypothetical protein